MALQYFSFFRYAKKDRGGWFLIRLIVHQNCEERKTSQIKNTKTERRIKGKGRIIEKSF